MSRITQGLLADEKELKMGKKSWEGSAKDTAQDKKLAKKHGMSMSSWEKSSMDTKHDTQQSTKGLRGGGIAVKGKGIALKKGGKVGKYAMGGVAVSSAPGQGGGAFGSALPGMKPGMEMVSGGGKGVPLPPNLGRAGGGNPPPMGRGGLRPVGGGEDANPPALFERGPGGVRLQPEGNMLNMPRRPFKKGGAVKEADSGEMYASKAAMKKHEAKESPAMEKAEHKRGGGIAVKGKGIALRGGGIAQRGMGIAMKGGGRAKGCM